MTTIREMKIDTNDYAVTINGLQYVLRTMRYEDLVSVAEQLEDFRKATGDPDQNPPEVSQTAITAQMLSDWASS